MLPSLDLSLILGNNTLPDDLCYLLSIIELFQGLSIIFLYFFVYNILVYNLNINLIEGYITKIFNSKIGSLIIKWLKNNQKISLYLALIFLTLTVFCLLSSNYYLNFILVNYEQIIKFYFK